MEQRLALRFIALMMLGNLAVLSAQTVRAPGQLAAAFKLPLNGEYSSSAIPKTTIATVDDSHDRFVNRLWISSIVAAVVGTSFDAASSWGQREGNSFLASSDGRFGAKGLGIKAGFAAATIIPQICLRRRTALKPAFTLGNFVEASLFTGVSVHNLHIRSANR